MRDSLHHYSVGALLYCPANLPSIVASLVEGKFSVPFSLALCLEDTIGDDSVEEAMEILTTSLHQLYHATESFYLPDIFIRVRNASQIESLWHNLGLTANIVTGFIAPKFTPDNAHGYISAIQSLNTTAQHPVYFMPILESPAMIDPSSRYAFLHELKCQLDAIAPWVTNVRIGGNDLCHAFSLRRSVDESIHDIPVVAQIFSDILAVFGRDYVVSGAVWEYYGGKGWDTGLAHELQADRRNGFIGKTVIHPKQIPLVNQAYQVSKTDYADACAILNWDPKHPRQVSGNVNHQRMNESKTHANWAQKTLLLAQVYGLRQN